MKKYFIFVLLVVAGLALVSCNKGKDQNNPENSQETPQNNPQDSTETNSYPYLTLSDITPFQLLSLSDAETKLTQMGFIGGYTGKAEVYEKYAYSKGNDSLFLVLDSTNIVNEVVYLASKGILPDSAKGWLKHIPEKIKVAANIAQLIGSSEVPFYIGSSMRKTTQNYADYLIMVNNLVPEGDVYAEWYLQKPDSIDGYYYAAGIHYKYTKNKDRAYLAAAVYKNIVNKPEPVDPTDE